MSVVITSTAAGNASKAIKQRLLGATLAAACLAVPVAGMAQETELAKRVEQLAAELEKVKAELAAQRAQAATAAAPRADVVAASMSPAQPASPDTVFSGYGEVNYNHPVRNAGGTQTDLRRAVIGIQHRFDEKTKVVAEFEWEHAIASATDRGESAIEQMYVEREFNGGLRAKAGLFLMPVGLLNQNHEPTAYYGVERNLVETAIIPTTWREAGVGLSGEFGDGFTWDTGLTTGFDLTKWDPASDAGRESPLGTIHQEGQLAKSRDLSLHGALNWRGYPALLVGGSVFTGMAGHATPAFVADDARVTLAELHTRYTPGAWDLSALWAYGRISNTGTLNATFVGNPTPVPSSFAGWYLQAAYKLWQGGDYAFSPFTRFESFSTARTYAQLPAGLDLPTTPYERVATIGANLAVGQGVVLKADYQKFREDKSRDRVNLGVGFAY